jgi:PAS domain S-box-containing protein
MQLISQLAGPQEHRAPGATRAFCSFDGRLCITFWDHEFEKLSGIQSDQAIGRAASELFPDFSESGEEGIFLRVLDGEYILNLVRPRRDFLNDGDGFFECTYLPFFGHEGKVAGGSLLLKESASPALRLTERRRSPTEIESQIRLLDQILSNSRDLVFLHDREGACYVNRTAANVIRASPADAINGVWEDLWLPEEAGNSLELWRKEVLDTGHFLTREICLPTPEGDRYFECLLSPVRGSGDLIEAVVSTFRDITDRVRAGKTQSLLASVVESSQDAIISSSLSGDILTWNAGAETLFGYSAREAIGRNLSFLLPPDRSWELPDLYQKLSRRESIVYCDPVLRKGGEEVKASLTFSPIVEVSGEVTGVSLLARDMTEWTLMLEALQTARNDLERLVEERTKQLVIKSKELEEQLTERVRVAGELQDSRVALKASEIKYRSLIESLPSVVYVTEPHPPYSPIYVSPKIEAFGYPVDDWYNSPNLWIQLIHPDDRPWVLLETEATLQERSESEIEYRMVARDGSVYWIHDSRHFVFDEQGQPFYWQCVLQNVTERHHAKEKLEESEQKFRRGFFAAPFPVMIHTEDGEVLQINKAWTDLSGYTPEDVPTVEAWTEKACEAKGEMAKALVYNLRAKDGKIGEREFAIRTKGGMRRVWTFSSALLGEMPDGRRSIISMAIDVTERRRAEEERETANMLVVRIFESITDAFFALNRDGQFTYVNAEAERLLQRSRAELLGKSIWEEFPWAVATELYRQQQRALAEMIAVGFEEFYPALNGWFTIRAYPSADGLSVFIKDVTERKLSDLALRRLAERLTTAQEEERRRISRQLHDEAGQALAAVSGRLHLLSERCANKSNTRHLCEELSELSAIIKATHKDLRGIAHGLHPSALEHFGLATAIRSYVNEAKGDTDVRLLLDIQDNFPRLSGAVESSLYRILQEGITNALKHGGAKTISLRLRATDNMALVVVRDDGCGFDLVEAWGRAGIGLVSMRERAEMIGAEFEIASLPGAGTQLSLCLSLKDLNHGSDMLILKLPGRK